MDKKVLKEIDNAIKYIWKYDIKKDYEDYSLLREDTLKNALYFHLRTKIGSLLDEHNIKIFTEFNLDKFRNTNYRPDMVLIQLDTETEHSSLEDCIKEYVCIIELKFKGAFTNIPDLIYKDYDKIRHYIENMDLNCPKYYMATIWEEYPDSKQWLDNESWAKGLVTELNADFNSKGNMQFYVKEHK